jgi:hypothetical protein
MNSWIYYATDKTFLPQNDGGCRRSLPTDQEMIGETEPYFMVGDYGDWEVRYPRLREFSEMSQEDWDEYGDRWETSDSGYQHSEEGDLELKGGYLVKAGCFPARPTMY